MKLISRDQISVPLGGGDLKIKGLSLEDIVWIIRVWREENPDIWTMFDVRIIRDNVVLTVTFDDDWEEESFGRRFIG